MIEKKIMEEEGMEVLNYNPVILYRHFVCDTGKSIRSRISIASLGLIKKYQF